MYVICSLCSLLLEERLWCINFIMEVLSWLYVSCIVNFGKEGITSKACLEWSIFYCRWTPLWRTLFLIIRYIYLVLLHSEWKLSLAFYTSLALISLITLITASVPHSVPLGSRNVPPIRCFIGCKCIVNYSCRICVSMKNDLQRLKLTLVALNVIQAKWCAGRQHMKNIYQMSLLYTCICHYDITKNFIFCMIRLYNLEI